ncbi:MAG: CDP-diacylglycerol--glycerol-3-phosphate 3-phosphatidyltransferase [Myxococcota bacterium]
MPTSPTQDLPLDKQTVRRSTREELTNLPNVLTLMRIVLILPIIALMVWDTPKTSFFAALLFGIAAATDWLDGWLARRRGQESLMGKLLDPLADKLIVMATLVIGAELGRIPGWFVVLLLSRELSITGLRAMASSEGLMIHVVETGKWKTALQLVGLVGIIVHYSYWVDFGFTRQIVNFNALGFGLLLLSMVFSLASAGAYFNSFLKAIAARKEGIS